MDSFEFHTHLEGAGDHSHGDASSQVIETSGHGVGSTAPGAGSAGLRHSQARYLPPVAPFPATARCWSPPIRARPSCRRKARPCVPI